MSHDDDDDDGQVCSFCRVVDYFAERGMLDEYDRAIVLRHLELHHNALRLGHRGSAVLAPRRAGL